jgi:hypothetical protein
LKKYGCHMQYTFYYNSQIDNYLGAIQGTLVKKRQPSGPIRRKRFILITYL